MWPGPLLCANDERVELKAEKAQCGRWDHIRPSVTDIYVTLNMKIELPWFYLNDALLFMSV